MVQYIGLPDVIAGSIVPVETVAALPTGVAEGSLRYVKDEDTIYAYNGTTWDSVSTNPAAVVGPGASTDNGVVRWDGVTGTQVQDSQVYISDTNSMSGIDELSASTVNVQTFSGSFALASGPGKDIIESSTTAAELAHLSGVTSSVQSQLTAKVDDTEKGAALGVATLDAGGKIPVAQLPNSIMEYLGTWAASTNTPTLANGVGSAGDVYVVSDDGTVDFGAGGIAFVAGDWVVYSGSVWQKSVNSNAVASVNGYTGAVVLAYSDITTGVVPTANGGTGVNSTATFPTSGTVVTRTATETLTNKAITGATTLSIDDIASTFNLGFVSDSGFSTPLTADRDITFDINNGSRMVTLHGNLTLSHHFETGGGFPVQLAATGSTAVTLPTSGTLATLAGTEALTNKTLGSTNTITGATAASLTVGGSTVTFPVAVTTLVGRNTTDSLTNKSIQGSTNVISIYDNNFEIQDGADSTKRVVFDIANVSTLTTRTFNVPNADTTLVGTDATQTLTNKTFDADGTGNSITNIENADIKAAAGIEGSKIVAATNAVAGVVSTTTQSFAGLKTFYDGVVLDEAAGQTTLNYYRDEDLGSSFTVSGGTTSASGASVSMWVTRVGAQVTARIILTTGSTVSNASITIPAGSIPSWAWPSSSHYSMQPVSFAGGEYGFLFIGSGGSLTFRNQDVNDGTTNIWLASTTIGVWYCTWSVH